MHVAPEFAKIVRDFEAMDGRNPMMFAYMLAEEVGATFKLMGSKGVFAPRNSGLNVLGAAMPIIEAMAGANLLGWDISPSRTRPSFSETSQRWYDFAEAAYKEEIETLKGKVRCVETAQSATQGIAKESAGGSKIGFERDAGVGSVTIRGNFRAQAGGKCALTGARPGVDGVYLIGTATHHADVSSGFVTTLDLKHPEGSAGVDPR